VRRGLITTAYCFAFAYKYFQYHWLDLSRLLLNQYLWLQDDIVSMSAVAFIYPLFTAFLYYLLVTRSAINA